MKTGGYRSTSGLSLSMVGVLLLVTSLFVPSLVEAAPSTLPVRPTPSPTPTITPFVSDVTAQDAAYGAIQLRAQGESWALTELQSLWTVVQWLDVEGEWQDVSGWRGPCDFVTGNECRKTWAVSPALLGDGPFRWAIYERRGGALRGTSINFSLPTSVDQPLTVLVMLEAGGVPLLPASGALAGGMVWLVASALALVGGALVLAGYITRAHVRIAD